MTASWRTKAERCIAEDCFRAWRLANPRGQKRHRPYSVPPQARALVDCLAVDDGHLAKVIFQHRARFGATEYAP